jgi:parallel beta-helix repeat protein
MDAGARRTSNQPRRADEQWERGMRRSARLSAGALVFLAAACSGEKKAQPPAPADASYQETLMTALLDAKPGDVIEIPEGKFSFDRSLSLAVDGVTIRGKGMDKSILSFRNQIAGAEGLLVTANDFTIEDLGIEDTKGDALKVNEGENIVIRRVRTEWTGGPKTENGAYGIYPVQAKNVLLESNVAIGASDAGIYVGQSQNVVVRYNRAEKNVAGIEIENTFDADVYENVATDNSGGILVFNMPNLKQPGARTRVFKNEAVANNRAKFGHPGTPVATIPAGSGVVINSNDQVEIFDNDIKDNKTANIIISSIFSSGLSREGMSADFDGYPEGVFVYANRMGGGGKNPDGLELQALRVAKFGPMGAIPDVLWDGFVDAAKQVDGATPPALRVCVDNEGADVINVDAPNTFKSPEIVTDRVRCAIDKLSPVKLAQGLGD